MEKRRLTTLRFITVVLILALFSGCTTPVGRVRTAKVEGKGTTKVYPVSPDQAYLITKATFGWLAARSIDDHRSKGHMIAWMQFLVGTQGLQMYTVSVPIGAWVEKVDQDNTRVTVVTQPPTGSNSEMVGRLSRQEIAFQKYFAGAVEIIKRGERLPAKPPE